MPFPRSSGLLLHPTSLPGPFGVGDLGSEAFEFVDFLAAHGQKLWQILPLGPPAHGHSPYQCFSSNAGHPLLVSAEKLADSGLLEHSHIGHAEHLAPGMVDYAHATRIKAQLLELAHHRFTGVHPWRADFERFCATHAWLDEYALFRALKHAHDGAPWHRWERAVARREGGALERARRTLGSAMDREKLAQYLFFRQWRELREHARARGVKIIGDLPIFVAYDSVDVWTRPDLFELDGEGWPTVVTGVPPDCFSETGQLWGNPHYHWEHMRADGFAWWVERMRSTLELVDIVRLDHFRGFAAVWEVDARETTAMHGRWVEVPGRELLFTLQGELGELPIIAEDLGIITPDVEALRDDFNFPGMRVLQFAFDGDASNLHLPHHHVKNAVVYTGTHDNDTVVGWFSEHARDRARRDHCLRYLASDGREIHWDFIRAAMASVASMAIIPVQDVLGLGSEARMNTPSVSEGNWSWRLAQDQLSPAHGRRLQELSEIFGR